MMDDFLTRSKILERQSIINYLSTISKPCYESELLKIAFDDTAVLDTDALTLYQNHFLLFNMLYHLQNEFYLQGKYLYIHFMRTFLYEYPAKDFCRFFNEDLMRFCNAKTFIDGEYCEFHKNQLENEVESLSIKYFYLDEENFNQQDSDTAESFINGAWEIFGNYENYKKSFEILELSESSNIETIKKQFKMLAKKYHPDHGESSHKKFNEINRAYRTLIKLIPVFKKKTF